jgi:RNA polymerase sigma factor (TIGR02999 family)
LEFPFVDDVTGIFRRLDSGEAAAAGELLPVVYDELRRLAKAKLAREKPGQTLDGTALVHEAFLRLVGKNESPRWQHRGHFFAAASEAMRRILVESARRKNSQKQGGGAAKAEAELDLLPNLPERDPLEVLAIHEVLDRLATHSPRKAELVKLRFFLGCTIQEAADILQIAHATAEEDWTYARAWLRRQWLRADKNSPTR